MNKKVIFVGGGASSIIGAILLKKENPSLDVLIIEKNNQIGKKLKATGSGRCNIAPITNDTSLFYNHEFVKETIGKIDVENYLNILKTIGILTKKIEGVGHYPISESAGNVVKLLQKQIDKLGISVLLSTKIIDYKIETKTVVCDNGDKIKYDYLVFANGGASYASLGGEDTLSNIFKEHGYRFNDQKPVLTPIKVKENIHKLFGIRLPSKVTLRCNNHFVYEEKGEVQFRKDGLSGIVILNISRFVEDNKKYTISLNAFESKESKVSFEDFINLYHSDNNFLLSLLPAELIEYGLSRLNIDPNFIKESDLKTIYNYFSNITFNFSKLFDLSFATVSRGGIDVGDIDFNFTSKKEPNVYFLGEIIDVDGPCGGYSLRFAITSAIIFAKNFLK